ncbi:MAG: peptidylprolyl isomerase [Coleofasciculaceae cyanobacterium]
MQETLDKLALPEINPATEQEIITYLRRSFQIGEMAAAAEQEVLTLSICEQLGISVSEEELQVAGDAFRTRNKLLEVSETLTWLTKQRITVEDWTDGIRASLLRQKLKEHLFSEAIDSDYINNRDRYRRLALSQILVGDRMEAVKITRTLQEQKASFCALALEHSKGKQSRENGGFVGIRLLLELLPEISQAVSDASEGEVIGPIQTKIGYHILRVEKWLPIQIQEVREQVLEFLFQDWLEARKHDAAKTDYLSS